MAKDYSPEELVTRTFGLTMAGVGLFIAAVFLFIL
jgi:hypothetical protein